MIKAKTKNKYYTPISEMTPAEQEAKRAYWLAAKKKQHTCSIDSALNQLVVGANTRSRKNFGSETGLDVEFLKTLWKKQKGLCAKFKVKMSIEQGTRLNKNLFRVSVDRIDNTKGYTRDNVQLVSWGYNSLKSAGEDGSATQFVKAVRTAK